MTLLQTIQTTEIFSMSIDKTRGHWTALPKSKGIYAHCDSYGNKPDRSLEWVTMKTRRRLNESTPYLTKQLKHNQYTYINIKVQDRSGLVNTCGSHVVQETPQTEERQYGPPNILQLHEVDQGHVRHKLRCYLSRVRKTNCSDIKPPTLNVLKINQHDEC